MKYSGYFDNGALQFTDGVGGHAGRFNLKRGQVEFSAAQAGEIKNPGSSELVRTEFPDRRRQ